MFKTEMRRLWLGVSTICILASLVPDRVSAEEELQTAPEGAVEMEFDSKKGIWLPLAMAKKIQLDVERAKLYELKLQQLDTKLDIRQERIDKCKEALGHTEKSRDKAHEAVTELENAVETLEHEETVWYKQPVVLVGAGVVLTVILEVAAVAVLNAI